MSAQRGFRISGEVYTAPQMHDANSGDADFCAWLETAQPGDVYPGGGEPCECVAVDQA